MLMAFEATSREQPNIYRGPLPLAMLLAGPLLPCILSDLYVLPVLWAGVFIGLSVCAYGVRRPYLGVAAGLAAVFFRELALPYCLLGAAWPPGTNDAANSWPGWPDWPPGRCSSACIGSRSNNSWPPTPWPTAKAGSSSAASPSSWPPCK